MNLSCEGGCGLSEGSRCSTVEDSGALTVAVNGHRDHGARSRVLEHFHAGDFHECPWPVGTHPAAPGEGIRRGRYGVFRLVIVCHGI